MTSLPEYYGQRALEYEEMYRRDDPVRQSELAAMTALQQTLFRGRHILEVACGTGYWTERLAGVADRITAVDAAPEVLALARAKNLDAGKVVWLAGDAYALDQVPGAFDAGLANFWFSHVPRSRVTEFLAGFHRRLGPRAVVFLVDNVFVPGVGGELVHRPGCADTFKHRKLKDGSEHDVLKNYYAADELQSLFATHTRDLHLHVGACYWWLHYTI